jgi:hypothetical protein
VHSAYEVGDLRFYVYSDADSGMNHAAPAIGGFYFGFPTHPSVWAGWNMDLNGGWAPDEVLRSVVYGYSDQGLLENLDLFKGGANQATSWVPVLRVLQPSGAGGGGASLTLTSQATGFDRNAVIHWGESAGASSYTVWTAGEAISVTNSPVGANTNYLAQLALAHELRHLNKAGWYSLSVANQSSQILRDIDVEFAPDSGGASVRYKLKDSGTGGQDAGLIHLNEPGVITIRGTNAEPKLHGMEFADFISRAFDITLQKALLTVFLLAEVLPLSAWILVVWKVRSCAYKKISLLPRLERKHARHEVDLMLNFAKWCGVSCYLLWTAKDILVGAGIVFAGG